jgi:hypothetical protein
MLSRRRRYVESLRGVVVVDANERRRCVNVVRVWGR